MVSVKERIIELDANSFKEKLKELAKLYRKQSYIGFNLKMINSEFKLKLTFGDFLKLFDELKLPVRRGIVYFESLEEKDGSNT